MMKKIFFAYESGHHDTIDAIKKAIIEYNTHQRGFTAMSWEDLRVGGKIINRTVLENIDSSELFACDLTYLNHNVLFELGYAIGKKKKLLVFINTSIEGAKERYSACRFLKNIGYQQYTNYKHIQTELQTKDRVQTVLLSSLIKLDEAEIDTHDIFYISSKIDTQASLDLTEFLTSSQYRLIHDDTSEVEYQTLSWYIHSLYKVKNIVIHLHGKSTTDNLRHNAEYSFYAGIGCGLDKNVLLVAPAPFNAPIDYDDILVEYTSSEECVIKTEDWIRTQLGSVSSKHQVVRVPEADAIVVDKKYNLLKLGIGCEIAEEEKESLLHYFVEIEAYKKAASRSLSVFVGRKGSGKSALFIKLEKDLEKEAINYNVILKPDSDELLENVELSSVYRNEISKRSLFYSVWKFVILSKLLLAIENKIIQKEHTTLLPEEEKILEFRGNHRDLLSLNFFGAIKKIHEALNGKSIVENPAMLDELYKSYLTELIQVLRLYFKKEKYYTLNILADNLDKSWDSRNNLTVQSDMILGLLEYSDKIARELLSKEQDKQIKTNTIIMLRKDIYDYILQRTREPDKLTIRSYEIKWEHHGNLLKKLVEERFKYILNLTTSHEIEEVWKEYFDFSKDKHPFDLIKKLAVARPRDIIYILSKLFESAVNNDHAKVLDDDFIYAIEAYTIFLHNNMIAEVKAEFPKIENILHELQKSYYYETLCEYSKFKNIAISAGMKSAEVERLLESLFNNQYLIGVTDGGANVVIDNLQSLNKKLNERNWIFKNKVYLILNPQEFILKNKWRQKNWFMRI
ncbi:MAG: hypothetical protein WC539_02705 [Nitrospirota bacterium]